jgi:hypothetical protein
VHTLKELEKVLPSVASINGMQVKDYIQALSDEGQLRVEKIGSGNWYWSFLSEEKRARDTLLITLRNEKAKLEKSIAEVTEQVELANAGRDPEDIERVDLITKYETSRDELKKLKLELEGYKDGDPEEVVRKEKEVEMLKEKANRWTDNIYVLEEYLKQRLGGDREALEGVRSTYYGGEYVEGEGLKEW